MGMPNDAVPPAEKLVSVPRELERFGPIAETSYNEGAVRHVRFENMKHGLAHPHKDHIMWDFLQFLLAPTRPEPNSAPKEEL